MKNRWMWALAVIGLLVLSFSLFENSLKGELSFAPSKEDVELTQRQLDFNQDRKVDLEKDVRILLKAVHSRVYSDKYDLNKDKFVNNDDAIAMLSWMGNKGMFSEKSFFVKSDKEEVRLGPNDACTVADVGAAGFIRGDFDESGSLQLPDAIMSLNYLFNQGAQPDCLGLIDANGDGSANLQDPIYLLNYLFNFGLPPPAPFPNAGWPPVVIDVCGDGVDDDGDGDDCLTWEKIHPYTLDPAHENLMSIIEVFDAAGNSEGYLAVGGYNKNVFIPGDGGVGGTWQSTTKAYVARYSLEGVLLWDNILGLPGNAEVANSVVQNFDANGNPEGFVLTGNTRPLQAPLSDFNVVVMVIDNDGDLIPGSYFSFGGSDFDEGNWIERISHNEYVVAANSQSFGTFPKIYTLHIDELGNELHSGTFGGANGYNTIGFAADIGPSGDILALGNYYYVGLTDETFVQSPWEVYYGQYSVREGHYDSNGDIYAAGITQINGPGGGFQHFDASVITFSGYNGINPPSFTDAGSYGDANHNEQFNSVYESSHGGFVMAGDRLPNSGPVQSYFYIVKANNLLDEEWSKYYGSPGSADTAASIIQSTDGGYIAAGTNCPGTCDAYVVKINELGNII